MVIPTLARSRRPACALLLLLFVCAATATPARERKPRGPVLDPSSAYAAFVLAEVAEAVEMRSPISIFRAPVDAARAVTIDGSQAIVYNPSFLDDVTERAGTSWAAVSVIAHELGHHYYRHSADRISDLDEETVRQRELDADYFSGYALARMGASLEDAEAAQNALYDERGTPTHPKSPERLQAILAGWLDGSDGVALPARPTDRIARVAPPGGAASFGFAPPAFPSGSW